MTEETMNRLAAAIERLADVLTEKGEKESPPFNPPKGKDPKRKPHPACARACEDAGFDRLFDEFWAALAVAKKNFRPANKR